MSPHDITADRHPLIFISAAEPSADRHGAHLIEATLKRCPSARFVGVAGPKMRAAGCRGMFDMTRHAAMLLGVVGLVGKACRLLNTAEAYFRRFPFDAVVVIDSPTLHLPMARRAQACGLPLMYYIAPQLWAWGAWRMQKLRDWFDEVAVILPFEEAYFREHGVRAHFVGHPLVDQLCSQAIKQETVSTLRGEAEPFIALLPGSRKHVVAEVIEGQLAVAQRILADFPRVGFGVSVASKRVEPVIRRAVMESGLPVQLVDTNHAALIQAADLVLVASGTTTLEVAWHGKPMVIMYNASKWTYELIGRWLIKTEHLSLPNILAGREIVPEFMPYYESTDPIADRALQLLGDADQRTRMQADLASLIASLGTQNAADETAKRLLQLVAHHCGG